VQEIGKSPMPPNLPLVGLSQMLTGKYDSQWVQVEGVVHSVRQFGKFGRNVTLEIASDGVPFSAVTISDENSDYSALVDARIQIRGVAASLFNRSGQMTGARVFFSGLAAVKVLQPAIASPMELPIQPIGNLLRFSPATAAGHRIHIRGAVTLHWPGRSLCLQTGVAGICVETVQSRPLAEGEIVDVIGFPAVSGQTPTLTDATLRSAGPGPPVFPTAVTAEQALHGGHDAQLVEIEGKLIGKDLGAQDPTMVLSSGDSLFPVILPASPSSMALSRWEEGSTLRLRGICSVLLAEGGATSDGYSVPVAFRILLRSPKDVVVLRKATWWTSAHLLPVLAMALIATLCVLAWVAALRSRIADQTMLIQRQNVTLRSLSFQDGLTGVANRRMFDETLQAEFRRAADAATFISLLMIDIDHFKALNDKYGHPCGDECLVQVAKALTSATLRSSDLLARYGGEEFAVIMPMCDERGALLVGECLRVAVQDLAIVHAESQFKLSISVSVGAATMRPHDGANAKALIALADRALYQSKQQGRNRVTGGTPEQHRLESAECR
jgi:diguanylate cyclase (GGDEF)-like protein